MGQLKGKIIKLISRFEGGERISNTLRKYVHNTYGVKVGMHTYGSCFDSFFNVGGKVEIGRYTSFGPNVHYFGANHPMEYASMSPYFYQKSWGGNEVKDISRFKLVVGNDVWIGYGVVITSKCCSIGNGAVIGAGSIVTRDVEPYSIVVGNPAKVIGYRFPNHVIEILEASKWYELEPDELLKFYNDIASPDVFAGKIIEYKNNKKLNNEA